MTKHYLQAGSSACWLILVLAHSAAATPVAFGGHSYDLVLSSGTWAEARSDAAQQTFVGESGYLVTITSAAENAFLFATFDNVLDLFAFIGGTDAAVEGEWRWDVGPEAGTQFSQGATPTAPFNYANWGAVEPNNAPPGEDVADINLGPLAVAGTGPGQWSDTKDFTVLTAYLVEFNVVPEPSTALLMGLGLVGLAARKETRSPVRQ